MKHKVLMTAGILTRGLVLVACTTDAWNEAPEAPETTQGAEGDGETDAGNAAEGTPEGEFFVRADYETELAQRGMAPEGDSDTPWLQMIEPIDLVDTSEFARESGAATLCSPIAVVSTPWPVAGFTTMEQQVQVLQEAGVIGECRVAGAGGDDNKRISDIQAFIPDGACDATFI